MFLVTLVLRQKAADKKIILIPLVPPWLCSKLYKKLEYIEKLENSWLPTCGAQSLITHNVLQIYLAFGVYSPARSG